MGRGAEGRTASQAAQDQTQTQATKMKTIQIDGVVYDVSKFRHPGGSIINFLSHEGVDATNAYREFHQRSSKADKYLKSLPVVSREPAATSRFSKDEVARREAMTRDYQALRAELQEEGYFNVSVPHMVWRMVEIVVLFSASFALFARGDVPSIVAAVVLSGVAQGRCGWLMHEMGHGSFSGVWWLDHRLQEFWYGVGCGMSGGWWTVQHSKHHATPQKLKHDVDLDTLPLVAFNEAISRKVKPGSLMARWLSIQAYVFVPVSCFLVGMGWTLFLHPRYILRKRKGGEALWISVRYLGWTALFYAMGYSLNQALGLYLLSFGLGCVYIFSQFALSHTHLDVAGEDEFPHWIEYAAKHTTNIACDSYLVTWWMSYLNYQIEHHLFPAAPQFRFPQIRPRVRALFHKHGLPYDERPYWSCMGDTFRNLHAVGNAAGAGEVPQKAN